MRTKITLQTAFLLSLFMFTFSLSIGQSWDWGQQGIGGTKANDFGCSVATDRHGNAFVAKQFISQITFGPYTLIGPPEDNMYFVKYNSAGVVQWAKCPNQSYFSQTIVTSLITDTAGNVFITGFFNDSLYFGSTRLYANSTSMFLVKYDNNGNVLWARQASSGTSFPTSVATDEKGNCYVTGYYVGLAVFGSYFLSSSGAATTPIIVKYDKNGNVVWATEATFPTNLCGGEAESIATDDFGNIYVSGYFTDSIRFGSYALNGTLNNSTGNVFLAKYDSSGNPKWARMANAVSGLSYGMGYSVTTDRSGSPYIAGYFNDSMSFGTQLLAANHDSTIFIAKYDSSGNFSWAEQTTKGPWLGLSLASDMNNVYLGGIGTADTLSIGWNTLYNPGDNSSSFILKFSPAGNMVCGSILKNGGGTGKTYAGIASDVTGSYIYLAGVLYQDTIFSGSDTLIAYTGGTSPYVARWQTCDAITGINPEQSPVSSVLVYPNPNDGIFTVVCHSERSEESQTKIEIYNIMGQQVYFATLKQVQGDNLIDLTGQPNGIYLYRVISENGNLIGEGKVVIQK